MSETETEGFYAEEIVDTGDAWPEDDASIPGDIVDPDVVWPEDDGSDPGATWPEDDGSGDVPGGVVDPEAWPGDMSTGASDPSDILDPGVWTAEGGVGGILGGLADIHNAVVDNGDPSDLPMNESPLTELDPEPLDLM